MSEFTGYWSVEQADSGDSDDWAFHSFTYLLFSWHGASRGPSARAAAFSGSSGTMQFLSCVACSGHWAVLQSVCLSVRLSVCSKPVAQNQGPSEGDAMTRLRHGPYVISAPPWIFVPPSGKNYIHLVLFIFFIKLRRYEFWFSILGRQGCTTKGPPKIEVHGTYCTTRVSRYQKVKPIWILLKQVASAGPYANNLHLAPHQHLITYFLHK